MEWGKGIYNKISVVWEVVSNLIWFFFMLENYYCESLHKSNFSQI